MDAGFNKRWIQTHAIYTQKNSLVGVCELGDYIYPKE